MHGGCSVYPFAAPKMDTIGQAAQAHGRCDSRGGKVRHEGQLTANMKTLRGSMSAGSGLCRRRCIRLCHMQTACH
jgi:hypothetical protein